MMEKRYTGRTIILIFLATLTGMFSCKEIDEDPGLIKVSLVMSSSGDEALGIEEGKFFVNEIFIEAQTESGNRTNFNEELRQEFVLGPAGKEEMLQFRLPPAVYTSMKIRLELRSENEQSSIYLKGERKGLGPLPLPFVFENRSSEQVDMEVRGVSGNQVVVKRGAQNLITLEVKPQVWFQPIGLGQWLAGELRPFEGKETVWISSEHNPEMFQIVNGRLKQSFSAKFE